MDVISIGEMVIDFIPGSEENSFIANAGGAPANVAIAMARNDLEVGFIGKVGNDNFGKMLVATLQENNVAILNDIMTDKAVTTMAFVHLDEHKERSFTFARKPGADMFLSPEDVCSEVLNKTKIIHAGSCSLSAEPAAEATKEALRTGKGLGKIISFDLNYRNLMWNDDRDAARKAVEEILPYVDLLKISDEERFIYDAYDSVFDFMKENGISLLVETLGKEGAVCYFNDQKVFMPIYPGPRVETTGAGDAFWGAFLSTLVYEKVLNMEDMNEKIITKALKYGTVAGGLCVREKGAISSLPTRSRMMDAVAGFNEGEYR